MKLAYLLALYFILAAQQPLYAQTHFDVNKLHIEWLLFKNHYEDKPQFLAAITIANNSGEALPAAGWKIYFSLRYHGPSLTTINTPFTIKHINGDLFCIVPAARFKGLQPNTKTVIQFTAAGRVANYNDVPSGWFWVNDTDNNTAININNFAVNRNGGEALIEPNAAAIFNENKSILDIPADQLPPIFPTPVEYSETKKNFILNGETAIYADSIFINEAGYLADETKAFLGSRLPVIDKPRQNNIIVIAKKEGLPAEAYQLTVLQDIITIYASGAAGAFYGIQSLKSLLPPEAFQSIHPSLTIKGVIVKDGPAFPQRAFMLDVSRHFQSKVEILRVLDVMAMYKLNVFHLHFSDDEGWRLQIPGLPELTSVGAYRGYPFDKNERLLPSYGSGPDANNSACGSGYYSVEDFIEILRYATVRHIIVIPEIESPGHARAAIKAMDARYGKLMEASRSGGDSRPSKKILEITEEAKKYLLHDMADSSQYTSAQMYNDNVMNAALPSTYTFIGKVIDEIQSMYKQAGAPLAIIHMGGDEVPEGAWIKSPAVHDLMQKDKTLRNADDLWKTFFVRINRMLKAKGLALYGWEELVTGKPDEKDIRTVNANAAFANDHIQVDAWANVIGGGNEAIPYQLANARYKVLLSCFDYFYFDLAQKPSFDEPGDAWIGYLDVNKVFSFIPYNYYKNAKEDIAGNRLPADLLKGKEQLTPVGVQNIVGLQGAMWQENIGTPKLFEYMLLPRLLALAERAWAKEPAWAITNDAVIAQQEYEKDLSVFVNVLGKRELPKLSFYNVGYNYRIPSAGAIVSNREVIANVQMPGFDIHYTVDGSEPSLKSNIYLSPISNKGIIKLTVFDKAGRSGKTIAIENK